MLAIAEVLRQALLPFLAITGAVLGALLAGLVLQRAVREMAWWRKTRLERRYQPAVDRLLRGEVANPKALWLIRAPGRHRRLIASLLVEPLQELGVESRVVEELDRDVGLELQAPLLFDEALDVGDDPLEILRRGGG